MKSENNYCTSRIPLSDRLSFVNLTLIRVGQWTSLSQFMLGAMLGHAMTFEQAMLATVCGSVILELLSLGLGIAGSNEGLSSSTLSRFCGFGRLGSALIGIIIAASLMGWFGVQNGIFAKSLNFSTGNRLGFIWAAVISGLTLTALVALGVQAINWTARIAVPLFFVVTGWIFFTLLKDASLTELFSVVPSGKAMSLGTGITVVAGACMTGAFSTPDISRYCKNRRHVVGMTLISIAIGEIVVNGIAILIAHTLDTDDVVTIMAQTAGGIGLMTVILSAIKINDINLYSSSLGLANALEVITGKTCSYVWLTVILGIIGTMLSVCGMLDRYVNFLELMGLIFPPVMGVMLTDYYILRTHRKLLDETRQQGTLPDASLIPLTGWPAVASCITGSVTGYFTQAGIPPVNALISASITYWLISLLIRRVTHRSGR